MILLIRDSNCNYLFCMFLHILISSNVRRYFVIISPSPPIISSFPSSPLSRNLLFLLILLRCGPLILLLLSSPYVSLSFGMYIASSEWVCLLFEFGFSHNKDYSSPRSRIPMDN
ncbi:unnamed protein product [Cuscuta epithymum]|uniref:Uncharacterized protein n=1 Tax=Cuscuta epithymum TaxID=186058 RepID=A0AAV0G2I5_9ASTE|nr:unnamed protein product [Cuscuta epithymum]